MYPASFFCQQMNTEKKSQQIITKGHKLFYYHKEEQRTKTKTAIRMEN